MPPVIYYGWYDEARGKWLVSSAPPDAPTRGPAHVFDDKGQAEDALVNRQRSIMWADRFGKFTTDAA